MGSVLLNDRLAHYSLLQGLPAIVYITGITAPRVINDLLGGMYMPASSGVPIIFVYDSTRARISVELCSDNARVLGVLTTIEECASSTVMAMASGMTTGFIRVTGDFIHGSPGITLVVCADRYIESYPADSLLIATPVPILWPALHRAMCAIFSCRPLPTSYTQVITSDTGCVTCSVAVNSVYQLSRILSDASFDWLYCIDTMCFTLKHMTLHDLEQHVTSSRAKCMLHAEELTICPITVPEAIDKKATDGFVNGVRRGLVHSAFDVGLLAVSSYARALEFSAPLAGFSRIAFFNFVIDLVMKVIPDPRGVPWEIYEQIAGDLYAVRPFSSIKI